MVKIAVLGDTESIKGFSAVGLDIFCCDDDEKAEEKLKNIVGAGYGIIYVTEPLVMILTKEINKINKQLSPSVVPIPSVKGNTGIGTAMLKEAVEKAVGSDIIFNK